MPSLFCDAIALFCQYLYLICTSKQLGFKVEHSALLFLHLNTLNDTKVNLSHLIAREVNPLLVMMEKDTTILPNDFITNYCFGGGVAD